MKELSESFFSSDSIKNLKSEIDYHFKNYESYEILKIIYISKLDGSIWSQSLIRTNGKHGHEISLKYIPNSEYWSNTSDNFIKHFG